MGWATAGRARSSVDAWGDGYVTDVPYWDLMIVDLCPAALSMTAVLHGQPPLDLSAPLTWVDLGCGTGVSACMVAAAHANVTVWGCDFNPAHIERARDLARRAGLDNCKFDEASFEALGADDRLGPADVDVVVIHGVYSWISASNQHHIAEFLRRRLRPGGLVYVMYEVATGWSSMVPLAEAMRLQVHADGRRGDLAFADAAATMYRLAENGARYFPLGAREQQQFAELATANPLYATHEYLGENFGPLMFDSVRDAMAAARCSHVGSIEATDQMTHWIPQWIHELPIAANDTAARLVIHDLVVQRALRRDLFRRGLAVTTPPEHERRLRELEVVGLGKDFDPEGLVWAPVADVKLDPRYYVPLVEALAAGPLDVGAIEGMHPDWTAADAISALCFLVAGGYAAPSIRDWGSGPTRSAVRRLNQVLIEENRYGADHRSLVSPATGGGVTAEYVETLTIGALWDGSPAEIDGLTDGVLAEMARQGRMILDDNGIVEDPAQARAIVADRVGDALGRMSGVLARLGLS